MVIILLLYRAEGKVKHCRVQEDESGNVIIGGAIFDTLSELISHYQKYPLYRKVKLRYAITDMVLGNMERMMNERESIYGTYISPEEVMQQKITVRALYDYNAQRQDELSFCQGAIITNVDKVDGGWWNGDYGQHHKGWFPANHVEEIAEVKEEKQLGNLQQGAVDIPGCTVGMHECGCLNAVCSAFHCL